MSVESYEEQILKAVEILTDGAIKDLRFDKSILATVESIQDITTGEHKVRFQDGTFSAFSSSPGLYYAPGSLVYVQIPQGDFSERKIILSGKTTLPNNELAEYVNDFIDNKYSEDAKAWIQSWWTPSDEDPADSWTDSLAVHEGDFWYQTDTNNYFRYTLGEEGIYQWEIIQGIHAVSGFLTNENHTVAAAADGAGYDLTGAGGVFKVYNGITEVTNQCDFSGGATKSELTLTISSAGVYSLSGPSWTSNSETFTLNATYNGVTISKVYTITKSLAGVDAEIYEVEIDPPSINRGRDGVLTPSSLTIKAYKRVGNAVVRDNYLGKFKIYENDSSIATYSSTNNEHTYTYSPSSSEVNHIKVELYEAAIEGFGVLLDTQSAVITNDATGGNLLYINEWIPVAEITNSTFPHWSVTTITETPEIINHTIELISSPYNTLTNGCKIITSNTGVDTKASMISDDFKIEDTKKYRFTIWFKKLIENEGVIYFGTKIGGVETNFRTISSSDNLDLDQWYLFVGHVNAYGHNLNDNSSGIYTLEGIKIGETSSDLNWSLGQTESNFYFSSGNNNGEEEVLFYAPRVELCDGNEISIKNFFPIFDLVKNLEDYYNTSFQSLNDDLIISASEKRNLLDFWKNLQADYSSLLNKVNNNTFFSNNVDISSLKNDLIEAYNSLNNYLNNDLKVFNNIGSDTLLLASIQRGGVDMLVSEINSEDIVYFNQIEYWDKKWNDYLAEAKPILEEEMLRIQLDLLSSNDISLGTITDYVMDDLTGQITAITENLDFTDDGLEINTIGSSYKVVISNTAITMWDNTTEKITIDVLTDTINISKLEGVNSINLGGYYFKKETPSGHPPQLTIKYSG
ncbi:MAG: hypothetical protein RBR68_07510 [Tenuifilaceae bacterium]|nr:hypothetical protein [Tenuifilaceae bacterium]